MVNLELIKDYFRLRRSSTTDVGLFEFGVRGYRFDAFLFNSHQRRFKGYEFKTSRADFIRDIRKEKWRGYLKFCHTFSFVCPKGLIQKEEVESPAGLLWITSISEYYGYDYSRPEIPKPLWQKMPRKLGEISREDFEYIILLLISRVKWRSGDFF